MAATAAASTSDEYRSGEGFQELIDAAGGLGEDLIHDGGKFFGNVADKVGGFFKGIGDGFNKHVVEPVKGGIDAAGKWIGERVDDVKEIGTNVINGVKDIGGKVIDGIGDFGAGAGNVIGNAWKSFSQGAGKVIDEVIVQPYKEGVENRRKGMDEPAPVESQENEGPEF